MITLMRTSPVRALVRLSIWAGWWLPYEHIEPYRSLFLYELVHNIAFTDTLVLVPAAILIFFLSFSSRSMKIQSSRDWQNLNYCKFELLRVKLWASSVFAGISEALWKSNIWIIYIIKVSIIKIPLYFIQALWCNDSLLLIISVVFV